MTPPRLSSCWPEEEIGRASNMLRVLSASSLLFRVFRVFRGFPSSSNSPFARTRDWRHGSEGAFDLAENQFSRLNAELQVLLALFRRRGPCLAPSAAFCNPMHRTGIAEKISRVHRPHIFDFIFGKRRHFLVEFFPVHQRGIDRQ